LQDLEPEIVHVPVGGKVNMLTGINYEKIDDQGLHILIDGEKQILAVDHVVVCSGQHSARDLEDELKKSNVKTHIIGGANLAAEIDAKRAIRQGCELAAAI